MNYPYHSLSKAELRTLIRSRRRKLGPETKNYLDQQITINVLSLARTYSAIAAYLPLSDEPGGDHLVTQLYGAVEQLWLPVCRPDFSLAWGRYNGAESLNPGHYGLLEPIPTHNNSILAELDAIIIPALAIAPDGTRLGQGAGFYDRALAHCQQPIIGVVYSFEVHKVPQEPHDVKCTAIITEEGTTWCQPAV